MDFGDWLEHNVRGVVNADNRILDYHTPWVGADTEDFFLIFDKNVKLTNAADFAKTIDNDLKCTAFTFGFNSAVLCCADALDRLHTTAASHGRVMVLEVMGRHTGWIALHGGIAGGGRCVPGRAPLLPDGHW